MWRNLHAPLLWGFVLCRWFANTVSEFGFEHTQSQTIWVTMGYACHLQVLWAWSDECSLWPVVALELLTLWEGWATQIWNLSGQTPCDNTVVDNCALKGGKLPVKNLGELFVCWIGVRDLVTHATAKVGYWMLCWHFLLFSVWVCCKGCHTWRVFQIVSF
jgi:hypothetical protein